MQFRSDLHVCRLSQEVAASMEEASDCVKFLKPLKSYIVKVTDCTDLSIMPDAFGPLMQTMLLVWRHSQYFNTATKLLALLRRLGNSVIGHAKQFLPGISAP